MSNNTATIPSADEHFSFWEVDNPENPTKMWGKGKDGKWYLAVVKNDQGWYSVGDMTELVGDAIPAHLRNK
jgi:hypothetical protein